MNLPPEPQPRTPRRHEPLSSVRLDSLLAMQWPSPFVAAEGEKLVVSGTADPQAVGEYRRLGEALGRMRLERFMRVVLLTSAGAGEGRTLTAVNLAFTMSGAGSGRVLLVDADFGRPRVHELLQVSVAPGLYEYLASRGTQAMPVVGITQTLSVVPAGKRGADPIAPLDSENMRRFLGEVTAAFEWVIVDAPPVSVVPDPGLLTALADATLLVASPRTPAEQVSHAIAALGRDRIVGIVVNAA